MGAGAGAGAGPEAGAGAERSRPSGDAPAAPAPATRGATPRASTPRGPILAALLAAGAGRRLGGGRSKAFVELARGRSFADEIAATCQQAGIERVALVLAEDAEGRTPHGVWGIRNPLAAEEGMLSSIRAAIASPLARGIDALLVWPVDCPRVGADTVRALVRCRREDGALLAIPSSGGRRGHPALFGRELFADLDQAPPAEGARAVVRRHAASIRYVEAGPEVLDDVDTAADLEALRARPAEPGGGSARVGRPDAEEGSP